MRVLVTGSAGYVASCLIPKLLSAGYDVVGIDLFPCEWMATILRGNFEHHIGDIRNITKMREIMTGCDAIIHLACISNDPSFDMNPDIGKSINYDCFLPIVKAAKDAKIKRFIYASSSSVYGVKPETNVTEDLPLQPLTDYSKYKAMCEEILLAEREDGFEVVIIRPATVCGWARAVRLDLCVHILTMAALRHEEIKVWGGSQYRPNIHIQDICDAYIALLEAPSDKVDGEIFNCGYHNMTISETARMIKNVMRTRYNKDVVITTTPSNDDRSYHVSSDKIQNIIGFVPKHSITEAIDELIGAYRGGMIENPDNEKYYAIKRMKGIL